MRHLGSIRGIGTANYEGQQAQVGYAISVYTDGRFKDGVGEISASAAELLAIMNARNNAVLELESGGSLEFMVSEFDFSSDTASIKVSGPVPGF